jgi:DNA-binding NtrC family response regulator
MAATDLQFTPEALKVMMDYSWPGNVRELENAVERAVVLSSGPSLGTELLPEQLFQNGTHEAGSISAWKTSMGARCLKLWKVANAALSSICSARTNWSQTEAAERFKIPLSTLNQKIKRLQIDVKHRRDNGTHLDDE